MLLWVVVVLTHNEWVRQHDGPDIHPVSYLFAILVTIVAVFCVLAPRMRTAFRRQNYDDLTTEPRSKTASPESSSETQATPAAASASAGWAEDRITHTVPPPIRALLIIISSSGQKRQLAIPAEGLLLGRNDELGPAFAADMLVSRRHAVVRQRADGTIVVEDLNSANGTFVNDRRVREPTPLAAGDVLSIGKIKLSLDQDAQPASHDTAVVPTVRPATGPSPEDAILVAARAAFEKKDFDASGASFARLLSSPAHAADGYYGLGVVAMALGRAQDAQKLFLACLRADRSYANAWYQLGLLAETTSPEEAQRCFREALQHNPQHAAALRKLGTSQGTPPPPMPSAPSIPLPPGAVSPGAIRNPPGGGVVHPPPPAPPGAAQPAIIGDTQALIAEAPAGHIRGRVAGFNRRAEQSFFLHRLYLYVWDFRLERPGSPPVTVEMRGYRFFGDISNGDILDIEIPARWDRGVLGTKKVTNLTTESLVRTSYGRLQRTLAATAKALIALIIVAALILIGGHILTSHG